MAIKSVLFLVLTLALCVSGCDRLGGAEWHRTYKSPSTVCSIEQTSNGGYILIASKEISNDERDIWLIKLDSEGNEIWDKILSNSGNETASLVRETPDGGFLVAGCMKDAIEVVINTDSQGNKVSSKIIGNSLADYYWGQSIQQTSDGGVIIVGSKRVTYGNSDIWLIKTDSQGRNVWNKTFGGSERDRGIYVRQTSDSGYIVVGKTESYGAEWSAVWLIKTDSEGNETWNNIFDSSEKDIGYCVQETSDGGYILTGQRKWHIYSFVYWGCEYRVAGKVWLIKTDSEGRMVWEKTFSGPGPAYGSYVRQASDGGYIVVGTISASDCSGENRREDVWLIKTDSEGREIWNKTFNRSNSDHGNYVIETSDGGYILTAWYKEQSQSNNSDNNEERGIWVIKLAPRN